MCFSHKLDKSHVHKAIKFIKNVSKFQNTEILAFEKKLLSGVHALYLNIIYHFL